jgi:hypothetical protein
MSMDISGTWRWIKHLDRDGNEEPLHAHYSTYTFGDDGSGSLDGPGILSYPLKWKIVGGRLRFIVYFGNVRGAQAQTTVDFKMATKDELHIIDRYRHHDVYECVKQ